MKSKEEKIEMIEKMIKTQYDMPFSEYPYERGIRQGYIDAYKNIIEYIKDGLL